jgi:large subunit ribosomal protein L4
MVQVKELARGKVASREVDPSVFGERVLGRTLKAALVMYEANARQGTHKAKTRSEVNGPNKKLWQQKHTGRARMGTTKSPIWRGGGIIFGPRPRDYSFHMPKQARRLALNNAIFAKLRDGEVVIADGWPADKPSTKAAMSVLEALEIYDNALVVTETRDRTLWLSLRNVPFVDVCAVEDLNARIVLLRRHVVLTPEALAALEARARGERPVQDEREAEE